MRIRRRIAPFLAFAFLAACARETPPSAAPVPASAPAPAVASAPPPAAAQGNGTTGAASSASATDDDNYAVHVHKPDAQGYTELDWLAMMPRDELESLKEAAGTVVHTGNKRMKQFGSFRIVPDVLGRRIKLPGYVVPIESDDKGRMTEFFFVPFFGACIHVPPPPPNQIVHVHLSNPVKAPEIWEAFMLKGELRDEKIQTLMAGSAYSMGDATLEPYQG
ncbi:MAG: DUF3299 domain-containing protein [Rudaea sp.]|uniref:DUF3299 domain-containing protein n=1 Tax=Rudaea sp. TaxID=2136325 RepID=UPI0039E51904